MPPFRIKGINKILELIMVRVNKKKTILAHS